MKRLATVTAILAVLIGGCMMLLGIIVTPEPDPASCGRGVRGEAVIPTGDVPQVSGFSGEQIRNAAIILGAARDQGMDAYGQQLVLMTAIAESSLINVPHGDAVRNDTIGLFQTGPEWGPYQARMDPYQATVLFIDRLTAVDGWADMEPTLAAHKAQRNAVRDHYTPSWPLAGTLMAALGGTSFGPSSGQPCTPGGPGQVNANGWAHPFPEIVKWQNNFSDDRGSYTHAGEDLAAPAGTPIYAVADGTVIRAGCEGFQGRSPCNIIVDHGTDDQGRSIQSWYVHMYPDGVLTQVGTTVKAGQQIAAAGSNGNSTGPHLHLEIQIDGNVVDPTAFMTDRGIDITKPGTNPPPVAADGGGQDAVGWARTQLGIPYLLGGTGPDTYDCSGLTMRAYENAGMTLPRTSREQYAATTRITRDQLQPGDLIFWSRDGTPEGIYHVALYAGDNTIIQSPAPGRTVEEISLWTNNLYAYGRLT